MKKLKISIIDITFLIYPTSREVVAWSNDPEWYNLAGSLRHSVNAHGQLVCAPGTLKPLHIAKPGEYAPLLEKLNTAGIYPLRVINEIESEFHRQPTKGEIKHGHGATRYKTFAVHESGKLDLSFRASVMFPVSFKRWLKCPIDGLRYYY